MSLDFYFAGAESPVYLRKLIELNATHVAISFNEWQRRFSGDDLLKHVPLEMSVCVTAGVSKQEESFKWEEFADNYVEFCERNAEDALIYDMDAPHCPRPVREKTRERLSMLPNLVAFPIEPEELVSLTTQHERVGINARLAKSMAPSELRRLQATLYGSNITDPKMLRLAKFASTTSFAWMGSKRYGEIWIFARNKLHHYTAENLTKACRVHRRDIEAFGVSPERCAANDPDSLTALAVKSLQAVAESLSKRPRDRFAAEVADASPNPVMPQVVTIGPTPPAISPQESDISTPIEPVRSLLPVVSLKSQDQAQIVVSNQESLRQCDSCFLSTVCPRYTPDSSCGFNMPIELSNVEQRKQANQVVMEMQFQRVMFARFAEDLEGEGLQPAVGREMDRFFKMQESVKEIDTPVAPGAGVLSQFFSGIKGVDNGQTSEEDDEVEDVPGFEEEFVEAEVIESSPPG